MSERQVQPSGGNSARMLKAENDLLVNKASYVSDAALFSLELGGPGLIFTTLARASPRVAPLPRAGRRLQMPRRTALGSLGEARPADRGVLEPQVPGVGLGEGGCLNRRSLETERGGGGGRTVQF